MKRACAIVAAVVLTVGVGVANQGAKPAGAAGGGVAQAVMELEHQWAAASKASNGDTLAPLLADDFVALDADGTVHSKSEVVARTKTAKWKTNEIADMKVMVHGDSAVVTGSWTGVGTDGAGKAVNAKERWADTWVKMPNGKWQCVVSASAPTK